MKIPYLILIFVLTILTDGIVMPAFLHVHESFLVFVFFAALVVRYSEEPNLIGWGIAFAIVSELLLGLYPGTLVIAWLLTLGAWHLSMRLISLKLSLESVANVIPLLIGEFGVLSLLFIFVSAASRLFYRDTGAFLTLTTLIRTPFFVWYGVIAGLVYLVTLNSIRREPKFSRY